MTAAKLPPKARKIEQARKRRANRTEEQIRRDNAANTERMRRRYATNPLMRERQIHRSKEWALSNPDAVKEKKRRYDDRRRSDPETWVRHMISSLRGRSKRKGLPFDLTPDDLTVLIPADMTCPAIGIPIIFGGKLSRNSPSVDRIVPSKGYVRGNIVIISHKANSMKQDCVDPQELRRLADFLQGLLT